MLDAILGRLIPHYGQPDDPEARKGCGLLAGGVGLGLNLLLFAVKLCAGLLTGAISVTADAFNNLSDAAGSAVTLAGFKLAAQRADERHPFGHGRIEYLAGLAVSLLILLVGVELAQGSVGKILRPEPAVFSVLAVALLGLSIGVKLWMGWFYAAMGRRAQSPTLAAAAADARSDVLATSAVLAGLAASHFFHVQLDGWLGLLVAALILRTGWGAARDTLDPLLGTPPDPAMVADIEKLVLGYRQILGIHDLVVHDYGPGRRMMSVHAEVPADGSLVELHDVIDRAERELKERFGLEAVIHLDPVEMGDPGGTGCGRWRRGWPGRSTPPPPSTTSAGAGRGRCPSTWWCPTTWPCPTGRCGRRWRKSWRGGSRTAAHPSGWTAPMCCNFALFTNSSGISPQFGL